MELTSIDRRDSSVTSKLKCKNCRLFFRDNGNGGQCPECGQDLRRIKVHKIKPKNMKVNPIGLKIGAKQ